MVTVNFDVAVLTKGSRLSHPTELVARADLTLFQANDQARNRVAPHVVDDHTHMG